MAIKYLITRSCCVVRRQKDIFEVGHHTIQEILDFLIRPMHDYIFYDQQVACLIELLDSFYESELFVSFIGTHQSFDHIITNVFLIFIENDPARQVPVSKSQLNYFLYFYIVD